MIRKIVTTTASLGLLSSLLVGAASPTSKDSTDAGEDVLTPKIEESLETLIELEAGEDADELFDSLEEYAEEEGISPELAIEQAVAEAEESYYFDETYYGETDFELEGDYIDPEGNGEYFSTEEELSETDSGFSALSSGEAKRNIKVGSARNKGDVVYTPAKTAGYNHGHSGIYYSKTVLVEAPGLGKKSKATGQGSFLVAKGAHKQYVKTTSANRNRAANKAYNSYRGKSYNSNFANNKKTNSAKMNCSQLVWAAYKSTSGIDLDGNGGPGVYPGNIRDSSRTVTYKIF